MSNGIGKEHPYQRITDLKMVINLALDEVMKINDTAPANVKSEYNINYLFGSWYSAFLDVRWRVMRQGRVFTREDGELEVREYFSPEKIRERETQNEEARRDFERRVMEKRAETGCYTEDGLYERAFYAASGTLLLRFVDGSGITSTSEGMWCTASIGLFAPQSTMAQKWFASEGFEGIQKMIDAMKGTYAE